MTNAEQPPLYNENRIFLAQMFGEDFANRSEEDDLLVDEVIEANATLAESLYGRDIYHLVQNKDAAALCELHQENVNNISAPLEAVDNIDMAKVGIVVVRPELTPWLQQCTDLIFKNGLVILNDREVQISFNQYWGMYNHGLIDPGSCYEFPTRTLNYINRPAHLLLVAGQDQDTVSVSSRLNQELKGARGIHSANTFRGMVAMKATEAYIDNNAASFTPEANIAFDPIGAYRQLVRGGLTSSRDIYHQRADVPLAYYAAQGVHMPTREELPRDLRILCSLDDLAFINQQKTLLK